MRLALNNMLTLVLIVLVVFSFSSCNRHEPVPPPKVKLAPNPKERYEITVHIANNGPRIERVIGKVYYNIVNEEQCVPLDYTRALGGVRLNPDHVIDITFDKMADGAFIGNVFEDFFVPENYYGLGECKWTITAVSAGLAERGRKAHVVISGTFVRQGFGVMKSYCVLGGQMADPMGESCPGTKQYLIKHTENDVFETNVVSTRKFP